MVKIIFIIKSSKHSKFIKGEFYGEEALFCGAKAGKIKYRKILRKAKKYKPDFILADSKTAEFTDFSKLGKYPCYTPENLIYDNFGIIFERYLKLYGCGREKLTLGIATGDLRFLNKIEAFGSNLKSVYVFGCENGENEADAFFRNTGVAVVMRSILQLEECDLNFNFIKDKKLKSMKKTVVDFSYFGDFSRECEEIEKILIKYLLKFLKKT